jgi:predicted RNA-binding protein with PIN domain
LTKKKEYLLVDGYNIIFSWKQLKDIASNSLEAAREKLQQILSNYQGLTGLDIIIIFDAHKVNSGIENVVIYDNIRIIFTKEKETADTYIEKITEKLTKVGVVKVATSDYLEQIIILTKGAYRISSPELLEMVECATTKMRNDYTQNKPIKNNLLINNIDDATRDFLENLRRMKGR